MGVHTHVWYIHIHGLEHPCRYKHTEYTLAEKKEREKEITSVETKVFQEQLTRVGCSQTQILESKNHNLIKTVTSVKSKSNIQIDHLLPEDDLKGQKHMLEKNK